MVGSQQFQRASVGARSPGCRDRMSAEKEAIVIIADDQRDCGV